MLLVTACWRLCSIIWHNGVRLELSAQVVNTDVSLSTAKTSFRNVAGKPRYGQVVFARKTAFRGVNAFG